MNFEIVASKAELMQELNALLLNIPSSQLEFEVKGAKVNLNKLKLANIRLSINTLYATIIVKVHVIKKTLLSDVKADGEIEIDSFINFKINRDWHLDSTFHYLSHRWLESPDLDLGLIQFPVQSIVDSLIEKQRSQIEATLNEQLKTISDLSSYMRTVLPHVNQSFTMQRTAFQIVPQIKQLFINHVSDSEESIKIDCSLIAEPSFRISSEAADAQILPELIIQPKV